MCCAGRIRGLRDADSAPESGVTSVVPAAQQRVQPGLGRGIGGKRLWMRAAYRERNPQVIADTSFTWASTPGRPARAIVSSMTSTQSPCSRLR